MGYTTDEMLRDARDEAAESQATIADLRSRLALFAGFVCEGCGCAAAEIGSALCVDCDGAKYAPSVREAACVSVGMRALCGRRILEGVR